MRILIENGSHSLDNLGDIAMLQASVERITECWPESQCHVITHYADRLADHVPRAQPAVVPLPRWQRSLVRLASRKASSASPRLRSVIETAWKAMPARSHRADLTRQVAGHDLVVLCGCGLLADPFRVAAVRRLQLLDAAQQAGIPTALVSQGVGPIEHRDLLNWCRRVLPKARLISLREGIRGPALLRSMSVAPEQFMVTGDDSLSLAAVGSPSGRLGGALGVNLRLATYSGVDVADSSMLEQVQQRIRRFLDRRSAPMVGLSIQQTDHQRMRRALPSLVADQLTTYHPHRLEPMIAATRQCRVVLTGSYHAAVFALALGIPAIGLVNSRYYRWKFDGLRNLFGQGCLVVDVLDAGWDEALEQALESAWGSATVIGPTLLEASKRQIEAVRDAYSRLVELVGEPSG